MASRNHNVRNPAVKRILQELKEVNSSPSPDFLAGANPDDIFEWYFVMRGPPETEFEGGLYHGRILLPAEYPLKPPSFVMLTPSGRFETNIKICLSISAHHPEEWQPSWSVASALTALVAFLPTPGNGALGALDFPPVERRALAAKSRSFIPKNGNAETQSLIEDLHMRMLARGVSGGVSGGKTVHSSAPNSRKTTSERASSHRHSPAVSERSSSQPRSTTSGSVFGSGSARHSGRQTDEGANTTLAHKEVMESCLTQRRLMSNPTVSTDPSGFRVRGYPSELTLISLSGFLVFAIVAIIVKKVLVNMIGVDLSAYY